MSKKNAHLKKPKEPPRLIFTLIFSVMVFVILVVTMMIVGVAVYFLSYLNIIGEPGIAGALTALAISCIIIGTVISVFIGNIPLKPFNKLIDGMNSLAAGNYQTRLSLQVPRVGKELEDSFNIMAEELQNTEMLRSDFVNNFSHEFKTPIVSVQGFAKLLQKDNLSEEKRKEYASIIASESARLADMATKVLDLTKLENQNILTDVSEYNLSEQLRECILLLERKWTEKQTDIRADFTEYQICGNKEMLKQVWINLLDNAVKFSPVNGIVEILISENTEWISVKIINSGIKISDDDKKRIFQKFYQCDKSHASSGNGIGLAIVSRIVNLHDGKVWADDSGGGTAFTVMLPVKNKS